MNVTREDAVQSLAQVEEVTMKTKQALASAYAGPFLILWGFIWIVAYLGTQYFPVWANTIWGILSLFGAVGTVFISKRRYSQGPARRKSFRKAIYVANGFVLAPCFCICLCMAQYCQTEQWFRG